MFFIWTNLNSFIQECIVPSLDEISPVVLEEKIFEFVNVFLLFLYYLHLKNGGFPSFEQTWVLITQGCIVQIWLKSTSGSEGEDFLISSMYFRYFVIISPLKRAGSFIWINLKPLHPKVHCAKFGWNWHSGFGLEDLFISSM